MIEHYPLWLGYTDMPRFLDSPVTMVKAAGVVLTDSEGNDYIDLESGIRNVLLGYSQREIVEAVSLQLQTLPYARGAHFSNAPALELATMLAALSPVPRPRILFHNSGSEAVEAAVKIVRQQAFLRKDGRSTIITLKKGYHGQTIAALAASGETFSKEPFEPLPGGFVAVDTPTCIDDIEKLRAVLNTDPTIGAVMLEPILANGGVIQVPEEYLLELRKLCEANDLLLICDEVSTGFGRCGRWFMSEAYPPDILIVGKAITNGYLPLSAVVIAEKIWKEFDTHGYFRHGQTNLNHPACCAAGLATMEILKRIDAPAACRQKGSEVQESLRWLMSQGILEDVRGCGLMWAIIFSKALHLRKQSQKWLQHLLFNKGFVVGQIENALFISPALVMPSHHIERFADCLGELLE